MWSEDMRTAVLKKLNEAKAVLIAEIDRRIKADPVLAELDDQLDDLAVKLEGLYPQVDEE